MNEAKFPQKLQCLFDESKRYIILHGGRGGSKSWGVARALLIRGAQKPMRILCAREIQRSIVESSYQLLKDQIEELGLGDFYTVFNNEIRGDNGSLFIFAGLKHNISNIKSKEGVDCVWVEEAEVVSRHSWETLIPTIRKPKSQIIVTFNADIEESDTYQRFVIDAPSNSHVGKLTYRDNPWFPDVLEQERLDCLNRDPVAYDNIWEGNPKAAVEGAIYANEIQKAHDEGRIGSFKYDSLYPVSAFLDIGWADNTSIWFLQVINGQFRLIHSYQSQFQKTPHYVKYMQDLSYNYDRIVLPHDAEAEHANAERTWMQIYRQAFPNATVYSGERRSITLRLEATKNIFDKFYIDKEGCIDGIAALKRYHYAINPETGRSTKEPFHGAESNYADAVGYLALEAVEPSKEKITKKKANIIRRSGIR